MDPSRQRRAKRQEWLDTEIEDPKHLLDHRKTRDLAPKMVRVVMYLPPDVKAQAETIRENMQFGRGMSWGELFTWLLGRKLEKQQREWAERARAGDSR